MAVIYIFDGGKKLKRTVKNVAEIIHREGDYQAEAQITAKEEPEYGDHFGFMSISGSFKIFQITAIDLDDETGVCTLTGTDAAIAELEGIVLENLSLKDTNVWGAISKALNETGWTSRFAAANADLSINDIYYQTLWAALKTIGEAAGMRIEPEYQFSDNEISQKIIWVTNKNSTFSGLIYTRKKGARNIQLTKEGVPYSRVYPIGKIIGDTDPPEQVTIAEAVWSVANGDPTDKPAGQTWIEIPGATGYAYVYEDKKEEDPLRLTEKAFEDLQSRQNWKASGTANLSELTFEMGYANRNPEIWQKIAIRTEWGAVIEATILNIERYIVHTELTKLTVGEANEENTLENLLADMNGLLADTARAAGGAGAGAGKAKKMVLEAEELIQLNSRRIEANAEAIKLRATTVQVEELEKKTIVSFEETNLELTTVKGQLSTVRQDVDNINNNVSGLAGEVETIAGQVALRAYQYSVDELGNRVKNTEAELLLLPGKLEAKADLILLDGYVKAAQLETTNARISNLTSGLTKATVLDASLLKGDQAEITYLNANSFRLADNNMVIRTVSMGEVASVRAMVAGTTTQNVDLQHSHAVTENDDGTITLGEVSSSGGSFKIANTKAYKEGVLAAQNSVTLSTAGWVGPYGTNTVVASNGKSLIVELPPFAVTGGDVWSSEHKTTIMFTTPSVNLPVKQVIVDASSVYADGYAAGTAEGGVEDYKQGYEEGKTAWSPAALVKTGYNASDKTITVRAVNAKEVPLLWEDIDASEIYDAGAERVNLSSAGWILGENVVNASNGKSLTVQLPTFSAEVGIWNSQNKAIVNFYTPSVSVPLSQREVDGTEVYNRGKDSVSLSSDGWINGINTVEASNGKTFDVRLPTVTLRGGEYWDVENHTTNVFASVPGVNTPIAELALDASIIYDLGKAEVSLSAAEWQNGIKKITASNGTSLNVELPEFTSSEGSWAGTRKTVFFSTPSVNVPLLAVEVDAASVYENGKAGVTLAASGWVNGVNTVTASNGKTQRVELPEFSASEGNWSGNKKSVYFSTPSVNVPLLIAQVDASSVYENGRSSVGLSTAGWVNGINTVTASNGKSLNVELPEFQVSGGTTWANKKTTVYFSTQSVNQPLKSIQVDATSVYNEGYEAGYEAAKAATVVYGSIEEIRNTAPNTFYARGYARALVGGEQVDSTTFYDSQIIKVGQ